MKKEKRFEILGKMDDKSVNNAYELKKANRPAVMRWVAAAACLVVLAGAALGISSIFKKNNADVSDETLGFKTFLAVYPGRTEDEMREGSFLDGKGDPKWAAGYQKRAAKSKPLQKELETYYSRIMEKLIISEEENTVCSPINTYIAFSMLAEITDGNTRKQILDVLNARDIESLRENVSLLWKSNYADTESIKCLLADSLWLRDNLSFNEDTLKTLSEKYYASSFIGKTGSKEMDEALRKWIDDNTGGLLKEYTKDIATDPDTVVELVSTIYLKALWTDMFFSRNTKEETFHGSRGDTTVPMMHKSEMMGVYRSENFTSVGVPLWNSGAMHFLLPDEGVDVNSLVTDLEIFKALNYEDGDEKWSNPMVNLSVPKFKVSHKSDLYLTMKELGMTDLFNKDVSDFTPLTTDTDGINVIKADHAAMIEIDENGVTGAAYTDIAAADGGIFPEEQIDLVFDRPFMFIVTGIDGSVLFTGIVRNID